jgi:glycine/D-amino acid oxidase-like deaminating enzyme
VVVRLATPVSRVVRGTDGRVEAVDTPDERIATRAVVVAAGVWSRDVAASAGLDVPVFPRKGQIVVTERVPGLFRRKLMEGAYTATVESDDPGLQVAMAVESTRAGSLLLGSSRQHIGFDRMVDVRVTAAIAARALRFFPGLATARWIRGYAGLRPFSPDHRPLIGPLAEAPGVYVATGHEGAGICLAPVTGELIAGWVTDRPPLHLSPEAFRPDRFASHTPVASP